MFWYILCGLILIAGVLLIVLTDDWVMDYIGGLIVAVGVITTIIVVSTAIEAKSLTDTYPQRKAFYESVTAGSEYEDAAFKAEKAELNDGLFRAQWYRENMPFFSLWPEEVLTLEPIK